MGINTINIAKINSDNLDNFKLMQTEYTNNIDDVFLTMQEMLKFIKYQEKQIEDLQKEVDSNNNRGDSYDLYSR